MTAGDGMKPRPPTGEPRKNQVNLRLTDAEAAALAAAATAEGKKVSWWLMEVAVAAARTRTDGELTGQVRHAAWLVREALPAHDQMPDLLYAEVTAMRAAALPAVLAEILRRPRKDT